MSFLPFAQTLSLPQDIESCDTATALDCCSLAAAVPGSFFAVVLGPASLASCVDRDVRLVHYAEKQELAAKPGARRVAQRCTAHGCVW